MTNKQKILGKFKKDTKAMAQFMTNAIDCASGDECPAYEFCTKNFPGSGFYWDCEEILGAWLESEADDEEKQGQEKS